MSIQLHLSVKLTFRHHASNIYRTDVPLVPRHYTFYIFSQQIYLIVFFRLSLTILLYSSTNCLVFPNVALLGLQNINILHKWCAKL